MKDFIFKKTLLLCSFILLLICAAMVYALVSGAIPAIKEFGFFSFIFSKNWDPQKEIYGALPFISGTLYTSFLALLICFPFSISVALFTGEYFKGTKIASVVSSVVDLLSGIPSIVYGLWGFYVLRPIIMSLNLSPQGFGVLTSSLVLAIMMIPYAASLGRECIKMVPNELKEGAYSLGATRAEVVRTVIFPVAGSGITAAYILALGRAIGETMAVTMLIGNTLNIPVGIGDTGNTMASIIANQFGEADGLRLSSLLFLGLILFLITICVNLIGKYTLKRLSV